MTKNIFILSVISLPRLDSSSNNNHLPRGCQVPPQRGFPDVFIAEYSTALSEWRFSRVGMPYNAVVELQGVLSISAALSEGSMFSYFPLRRLLCLPQLRGILSILQSKHYMKLETRCLSFSMKYDKFTILTCHTPPIPMHECRHIYKAKANLLWNYT
jgi:hypothetical protein